MMILNRSFRSFSKNIHSCRRMTTDIQKQFDLSKEKLNTLKREPSNEIKLKIYGLFKQATVGPCNVPKPGMLDIVGKAKWSAWDAVKDLTKEQAQKEYIDVIESLVAPVATTVASSSAAECKYKELLVNISDDGICKIVFNRPEKKNAINVQMYREITQALKEAAINDSVTLAVTTGTGDYYCSGNDLSNFLSISPTDIPKFAKDAGELLKEYVASFIDFPKPLVALVNGPAVGISVTVLALYDAVYASDRVTFHTPFSNLGQTPEGCSTYTFPRIMGPSKASSMLLFNHKMTAQEAYQLGFATEVFPDHAFQKETDSRLKEFAQLPKTTLCESKKLLRSVIKSTLHQVNAAESEKLVEMWQGDDCKNAIIKFFQRKSNL